MVAQQLWSFTASAAGTEWASHYKTILVTIFRDATAGRIVQVLPISSNSIKMLRDNGAYPFTDPLPPQMIAALNTFYRDEVAALFQRMHEKWAADELLLAQTVSVQ